MFGSSDLLELVCNTGLLRRKAIEKVAKEFFLAPIDVEILSFLYNYPHAVTATDIEKQRAIKKNTISIHVENLVQMGFLERGDKRDDRRKVVLTLSDKAKSIAARCQKEYDGLARRLVEGLTEDEKEVQRHCLEVVSANAQKMIKEGGEK